MALYCPIGISHPHLITYKRTEIPRRLHSRHFVARRHYASKHKQQGAHDSLIPEVQGCDGSQISGTEICAATQRIGFCYMSIAIADLIVFLDHVQKVSIVLVLGRGSQIYGSHVASRTLLDAVRSQTLRISSIAL